LAKSLPAAGGVSLHNVTTQFGIVAIAGPRARELLAPLVDADLSNSAFPHWSSRELTVGLASDVRALRLNYVGELGWELHHPIEYQNQLFETILAAGVSHGLSLVGIRAVDSLRLEKSYRAFWRDLTPEFTALEAGLDRFVHFQKPAFVGQAALLKQRREGLQHGFAVLQLTTGTADPFQNETVYREGRPVGRITTAGYGHSVGSSLAHAYIDSPYAAVGTEVEVAILGERRSARVISPSPYDPEGARSRL
jgi:dimethylglycine dehydrogenase